MFVFLISVLALFGFSASAEWEETRWLQVAYTYTDFTFKDASLSQKGQLAGIRGEAGIHLFGNVAASIGGEYQDGHLNADGNSLSGGAVHSITGDYIRDTRMLAHALFNSFVVSTGLAQRYWYNNLGSGAYRQRTRFDYLPVLVTYHSNLLYVRAERDFVRRGRSLAQMSDQNPAARDVDFSLGGSSISLEVGYMLYSAKANTHVFAKYQTWNAEASDAQNDGVQTLSRPGSTTTLLQIGIGFQI
jgi:hypothetical protein